MNNDVIKIIVPHKFKQCTIGGAAGYAGYAEAYAEAYPHVK